MNIYSIITEIEKVDPEVYERLDSRRAIFKNFGGFGKKLAAAAVPLAMGSMFNKAYGQSSSAIVDVLNFALLLEYLESEYYKQIVAVGNPVVPVGPALGALTLIRDHEVAHVAALRATITQLGGTPITKTAADFDFTAKGNFSNYLTNYGTMLAIAQAFEDTGVRAYKGQAGNLISNNDVLQAALRIHSVEARHAAHIRRMRRDAPPIMANQKPWITGKELGGLPALVQPVYDGEEITTQATKPITGTFGGITISAAAASEAFDEPLTKAQVEAIVMPFIK